MTTLRITGGRYIAFSCRKCIDSYYTYEKADARFEDKGHTAMVAFTMEAA